MGRIQFRCPLYQSRRSGNITLFNHYPSEHACGCVTGYENKQVGRIAEAVIPGRDRAHHLVRNVIEEDRPIRQAAKQIQSEVSPRERKACANPHGTRLIAATFSKEMRRRPAALLQLREPCRPLPMFPEDY